MVDARNERIAAFQKAELIVDAAERQVRTGDMRGLVSLDSYLNAQLTLSLCRLEADPYYFPHLAQASKLTRTLSGNLKQKGDFCAEEALRWADRAKKHQADAAIHPINDEIAAADRAQAIGWLIWEASLFAK